MPLYACDRCGFMSAAFRADAAAAHRLEYPRCDGVVRIIFRSDDRSRGRRPTARPVHRHRARGSHETQGPPAQPEPACVLREHFDSDETLRLTLLGDLDIAAAETLSKRLAELKAADRPVRLDLSKVAFIDSSGIQALLLALADARWSGWRLEVAREVSPSVERAAQIVKIGQVLWPDDQDPPRTDAPAPRDAPHRPLEPPPAAKNRLAVVLRTKTEITAVRARQAAGGAASRPSGVRARAWVVRPGPDTCDGERPSER